MPVFVHMIAWSDAGIRKRYRGAEGARFQAAGLSNLANSLRLKVSVSITDLSLSHAFALG